MADATGPNGASQGTVRLEFRNVALNANAAVLAKANAAFAEDNFEEAYLGWTTILEHGGHARGSRLCLVNLCRASSR